MRTLILIIVVCAIAVIMLFNGGDGGEYGSNA